MGAEGAAGDRADKDDRVYQGQRITMLLIWPNNKKY